jgi:hypothetical protein
VSDLEQKLGQQLELGTDQALKEYAAALLDDPLKKVGRRLVERLLEQGLSPQWISCVRLHIPRRSVIMDDTVTIRRTVPKRLGMMREQLAAVALDAIMLSRVRWLIENHKRKAIFDSLYREIRLAIEGEERGSEIAERESRIAELLPAASTGLKVRQKLQEANEKAHGTKEEKSERWQKIKQAVSEACKDFEARREHPTKEKLYARAAELARCSPRTVRRVMEKYLPK